MAARGGRAPVRRYRWQPRDRPQHPQLRLPPEIDFTPAYYDRPFDLRRLDRLDLVAVYWMGPATAHMFLTFGFGDDHLAIPIEARTKPYATLPASSGSTSWCTSWPTSTTILAHAAVNPGHIPYSWKVNPLSSGYAPEYMYGRARLDRSLPFEELKRCAHINVAAQAAGKAPDFSQHIRTGLP